MKKLTALLLTIIVLFSLCCCGKAETGTSDNEIINVSTVDELISAIGSNRCIVMQTGTYDLTKSETYGKSTGNINCYWDKLWDGDYNLIISAVENMTIEGSNSNIVTLPRAADVLTIEDCRGINLQHLLVGHTLAAEACDGGVVKLRRSKNISMDYVSLYGCGTWGVYSEESENITLRDSEIYHCSSCAVDCWNGNGLTMFNCNIYDIGADDQYGGYCIFSLCEFSNIDIQMCRIHGNHTQYMIIGNGARNASLSNLNLFDNHFSKAFSYRGSVELRSLSLEGNTIDSWFASEEYDLDSKIKIDGVEYDSDGLNELYESQVASYGVGEIEVEPATINLDGLKEVHVKTADEFLAAIASDTVIILDSDKIDLTTAKDYGESSVEADIYYGMGRNLFEDKSYVWAERYDGCALLIGCVDNLHIKGPCEIVTGITYADVLTFYNCSNISIDQVTLGHDAEPGMCMGGVLLFDECNDVIIESCDLYGCGIQGIDATSCKAMYVQNTLIHDCSFTGVNFRDCTDVAFIGSRIENCPTPNYNLENCTNFSIDGKVMASSCSF